MNLAHIHLLLNHWPVIGAFVGLGLFLVALVANSDDLKQASLAFFGLLALLVIPTYMSGDIAHEVFKDAKVLLPEPLIKTHQGVALLALTSMILTGAVALVGLWRFSRMSQPSPSPLAQWNSAAVLILAIVTAGLMALTGNTGGAIRHPEVFSTQETSPIMTAIGDKVVPGTSWFVTESSRWIWPVLETLHFVGLILIVAAIGGLNLRLLGFWKEMPMGPLHRLLPWGIFGFGINIVTGMLFFIGMPFFYAFNLTVFLKIISIVIAGTILLVFNCTGVFKMWANLRPGEDPPALAKFIAATSLILWLAIIILGRYIPLTQDGLKAVTG